jgi:putative ABC transport system substrate-binding protein
MIGRRDFMTILGGAASWPLAARAQQLGPMRRLGVLMGLPESDPGGRAEVAALLAGLRDLGWREGERLRIDYRWPGADRERARIFAKEIVGLSPDVILARSTPATAALKVETRTIPIVFVQVAEPTVSGLVESLSHPGGNITGFTNFEASMGGKWLQLLKEIAPQVARVTIMFNPDTAPYARSFLGPAEAAAATLGVDVNTALVQSEAEIDRTIGALAGWEGSGLVTIPDTFTNEHRDLVIALAARYRIPAIYSNSAAGAGLISYAVDSLDVLRRAATYVDKIIKGERPGNLPVQQPTKFRLTINLKAAKALGLTAPPTLLVSADEVIE